MPSRNSRVRRHATEEAIIRKCRRGEHRVDAKQEELGGRVPKQAWPGAPGCPYPQGGDPRGQLGSVGVRQKEWGKTPQGEAAVVGGPGGYVRKQQ